MSKNKTIDELTTMLAIALRHRIGSIVNENELYAQRYAKDADVLLNEAKKISLKEHWNLYDKKEIKEELGKKLKYELKSKAFLNERKFEIMEREMEMVLREMGLE